MKAVLQGLLEGLVLVALFGAFMYVLVVLTKDMPDYDRGCLRGAGFAAGYFQMFDIKKRRTS